MSQEAILQVGKAEEAARDRLAGAQAKAKEIVVEAQNAAEQRLTEVKKQLAAETAEALRDEREKSQVYADGQLALSQKECDLLREQTAPRMEAAVLRVMERVMS